VISWHYSISVRRARTNDLFPIAQQGSVSVAILTHSAFLNAQQVIDMVSTELSIPSPVGGANHASAAVAIDADFDVRWAAWVERGRVHEQRVRRKFVLCAGALAIGAAILYAFLR
jgi:hypothetical protein